MIMNLYAELKHLFSNLDFLHTLQIKISAIEENLRQKKGPFRDLF